MALTANELKRAWTLFAGRVYGTDRPPIWNKPILKAAANDSEAWIVANRASFFAALPASFTAAASNDDKIDMFLAVLTAMRGR